MNEITTNAPISTSEVTLTKSVWTAQELTIESFIKWVGSLNPLLKVEKDFTTGELKDIQDIQGLLKTYAEKVNLENIQTQLMNNLVLSRAVGDNDFADRKFSLNLPSVETPIVEAEQV